MQGDIIRQQNDNRFLIDAGEEDGVQMGRVYDIVGGTMSDPLPVGQITAHSLGWGPVVAPEAVLDFVRQRIPAKRY